MQIVRIEEVCDWRRQKRHRRRLPHAIECQFGERRLLAQHRYWHLFLCNLCSSVLLFFYIKTSAIIFKNAVCYLFDSFKNNFYVLYVCYDLCSVLNIYLLKKSFSVVSFVIFIVFFCGIRAIQCKGDFVIFLSH